MPSDTELLKHLYDRFNARDMEAVLATMHRDVVWANGLEGGHVYGHDGVRDYLIEHSEEVEALSTPELLAQLEAAFPTATIQDFQSSLRAAADQTNKHANELRRYEAERRARLA